MRVEQYLTVDGDEELRLVVSRRNLRALLAKLDGHPPGSACTLIAPAHYGLVLISAEEDEVHYANLERVSAGIGEVPGSMHSDTEVIL